VFVAVSVPVVVPVCVFVGVSVPVFEGVATGVFVRVGVARLVPVIVVEGVITAVPVCVEFKTGPVGVTLFEHAPKAKNIKTPVIKRIFRFLLTLFSPLSIIIAKLYTYAENLSN
jgi:hypothetical protein